MLDAYSLWSSEVSWAPDSRCTEWVWCLFFSGCFSAWLHVTCFCKPPRGKQPLITAITICTHFITLICVCVSGPLSMCEHISQLEPILCPQLNRADASDEPSALNNRWWERGFTLPAQWESPDAITYTPIHSSVPSFLCLLNLTALWESSISAPFTEEILSEVKSIRLLAALDGCLGFIYAASFIWGLQPAVCLMRCVPNIQEKGS